MEPANMGKATFWIIITAVSLVLVIAILSVVVLFIWCKKAKNYPQETMSKKESSSVDMYLDNQLPCSIHQNLGSVPMYPQSNLEQNMISDIPVPQRPMFGDFGLNKRSDNFGATVSHIYMEVDPSYEVDSGFTEEGDFTGSCSDRKEDSVYNSSSGNSNVEHEFQQNLSRQRLPLSRSRPDIINMNSQSPIVNALALSHLKRNAIKSQPQNVFSVSKTIDTRQLQANNSSDEEQQGGGMVWTLQSKRDKARRQRRAGQRYKESSMSSPVAGNNTVRYGTEARGRDNLW